MRPNEKIKVLSTTAMIDDIVGRIGKERVDHIPLIVGEIDPHSYELVKGDDEKLKFAKAIFYNGLGLEHGASLRYALDHHPHAINLGSAIQKRDPESIIYTKEQIDPHIWMDILLWSYIIDPIAETLSAFDPAGKAFYEQNASDLKKEMEQKHHTLCSTFAKIPESKRYLVTSHGAFNYFARAYLTPLESSSKWQERAEAPEGLSPEGQLSTANIRMIVDHLISHQIHVVFPESNVSPDSLSKIQHACRQKGLNVTVAADPLYADAVGCSGSGVEDYFKMMEHNAVVMSKQWTEQ
jgi:manganese/zinc/iron transport system substrate-binding protein